MLPLCTCSSAARQSLLRSSSSRLPAAVHARSSLVQSAHRFASTTAATAAPSTAKTPSSATIKATTTAPPATAAPAAPAPLSSCPAGTKLTGLSITKDGTDPVALDDSAYPPWVWNLLKPRAAPSPSGSATDGGAGAAAAAVDARLWKERRAHKRAGKVAIKASNTLKG